MNLVRTFLFLFSAVSLIRGADPIVRYRTPLRMTYHMTFADDAMTIDSEANVGRASMRPPTITGKAE